MEKRDIVLVCFLILALLALAANFYNFSDYEDNSLQEIVYSYNQSENISAGETVSFQPTKIGTVDVTSGQVKTVNIEQNK